MKHSDKLQAPNSENFVLDREKVYKHQAEINRLHALKTLRDKQEAQKSCYVRSFNQTQPQHVFHSPGGSPSHGVHFSNLKDFLPKEEDSLSDLLAELREGSEEI